MGVLRRINESVCSGFRSLMKPWKKLYFKTFVEYDAETWRALSIYISIMISCFILVGVYAEFVFSASEQPYDPKFTSPMLVTRVYESPSALEIMWNSVGFGAAAVMAYIARMVNRGWVLKKFHFADYVMTFTMITFFCLFSLINIACNYRNNDFPAAEESNVMLHAAELAERVVGAKLMVGIQQSMLITLWGSKFCVWLFLLRLYSSLSRYEIVLWVVFVYMWIGFFVCQVNFLFGPCTPTSHYWTIPVHHPQCASYQTYLMVMLVFNISSDAALIIMSMPLVCAAQLPFKRKLLLALIYVLAGFKIVASIMNKRYLKLDSPQTTTTYRLWYLREAGPAVTIAAILCTWQLLQRLFRFTSFTNTSFSISDDGPLTDAHGFRQRILSIFSRPSVHRVQNRGMDNFNAQVDQATFTTTDTELEERNKWENRDTRRDTGFSILSFGQDDVARPAIIYRSMHNIA
ncbi:uncharacterized protein RCO7_03680 [Rhynchosporium graminicola]|uniref:Rhodopsin domain-containing protein n=1 Tax=Rhynchosporium graminicola TaxID=2792576 RepID=A0A1E1LGA1_9HELO|nr:uncharacterized protein RCO7_03680 [Rhynchosporium commune]